MILNTTVTKRGQRQRPTKRNKTLVVQEYEGGDVLRKLKDGNIERDKVKDVVSSFAALGVRPGDDDGSEGSEYFTSGASWSSGSDVDVSSLWPA